MRKSLALFVACLATAAVARAQGFAACNIVHTSSEREFAPKAVQTYADRYGTSVSHYLIGTADPNAPVTIESPACGVGGTTIGRSGYVGSIKPTGVNAGNGYDMISVLAFNTLGDDAIDASAWSRYSLRFYTIQNFINPAVAVAAAGYVLNVKILENRGDVQGTLGGRGVFNRPVVGSGNNTTGIDGAMGPFGAPVAGLISTVMADTRADRGDSAHGSCTIPAFGDDGKPGIHDSGSGGLYFTGDREAQVALAAGHEDNGYGAIKDAIRMAQDSGADFYACKYACTTPSPLIRNVDCGPGNSGAQAGDGIHFEGPLYIGVSAVWSGSEGASQRLQDSLALDNIIHLTGDSDFCADPPGGDPTKGPDAVACAVKLVGHN